MPGPKPKPTHLKLIEDIVKQLQETGESPSRQMRILPLQRNSAASISTMVSQLFSRQTLVSLGATDAAEAEIRKGLELEPDSAVAHGQLARLL